MRRVLWVAVMGLMSLPTVSLGDYPYATGPGGYVYYSGRCGRDCPYGSRPPLGQVWGPTTIVAGRGFCPAGNGWPLDARSHKPMTPSAPRGDAKSTLLK